MKENDIIFLVLERHQRSEIFRKPVLRKDGIQKKDLEAKRGRARQRFTKGNKRSRLWKTITLGDCSLDDVSEVHAGRRQSRLSLHTPHDI